MSLFIHNKDGNATFILVYVDDIIITYSSDPSITKLLATLRGEFTLKDLGELHFFLGIEVSKVDDRLVISQRSMSASCLPGPTFRTAKLVATPLSTT